MFAAPWGLFAADFSMFFVPLGLKLMPCCLAREANGELLIIRGLAIVLTLPPDPGLCEPPLSLLAVVPPSSYPPLASSSVEMYFSKFFW